jgi:hypothetical protein
MNHLIQKSGLVAIALVTFTSLFAPIVSAESASLTDSILRSAAISAQSFISLYQQGESAIQDAFPVYSEGYGFLDGSENDAPPILASGPSVLGLSNLKSKYKLIYRSSTVSLPLKRQDYYWGKFQNGKAGAREINRVPVLTPGKKVSLIGNGYITLSPSKGYVRPYNGYYYGSGLCWSTSLFGAVMDKANARFIKRFKVPLFVFKPRNRAPHSTWYSTYSKSNNGYGYSVLKSRYGGQDYTFQVNPQLKRNWKLKKLKIKIVMVANPKSKRAYKGQMLYGFILSNIKF